MYHVDVCVCVQKVALDVANSSSVLNSLKHFEYKDANGKDHVRVKNIRFCIIGVYYILICHDQCVGGEH